MHLPRASAAATASRLSDPILERRDVSLPYLVPLANAGEPRLVLAASFKRIAPSLWTATCAHVSVPSPSSGAAVLIRSLSLECPPLGMTVA